MDLLRRFGRLGVCVMAAVGVMGCQPEAEEPANVVLPEVIEEAIAPTVAAERFSEQDVALLQSAAAETAEDVARTARGSDDPVVIPAADEAETLADLLPNLGAAPEITNEVWINSEPLRLADLRGKVVLVEFWTFG